MSVFLPLRTAALSLAVLGVTGGVHCSELYQLCMLGGEVFPFADLI
jgi:hypothetical protein